MLDVKTRKCHFLKDIYPNVDWYKVLTLRFYAAAIVPQFGLVYTSLRSSALQLSVVEQWWQHVNEKKRCLGNFNCLLIINARTGFECGGKFVGNVPAPFKNIWDSRLCTRFCLFLRRVHPSPRTSQFPCRWENDLHVMQFSDDPKLTWHSMMYGTATIFRYHDDFLFLLEILQTGNSMQFRIELQSEVYAVRRSTHIRMRNARYYTSELYYARNELLNLPLCRESQVLIIPKRDQ